MNTTSTWTIARNSRTSFYEVHTLDCRHLWAPHLEVMDEREAATGAQAAADYEAANEECFTKLGPCARR